MWDLRFGVVAATVANCAFGRDPDADPLTAADFFASLDKEPEYEPTPQEMVSLLQVFASSVNNRPRK